jgi:alpha-ketoglutarate-dependent taurine dioxygenase
MCSSFSSAATTVLNANGTEKIAASSLARDSIFLIRTVEGAVYGKILFDGMKHAVRYDPCYMHPVNGSASVLAKLLKETGANSADCERFEWGGNNAIILDNWRCLHGREKVEGNEIGRELWRVYIGAGK